MKRFSSATLSNIFILSLALTILMHLGSARPAMATPGVAQSEVNACWALRNSHWLSPEKWTWQELCRGNVADLAKYSPDPRAHNLSARFLVEILGNPFYSDVLPFGQMIISHAVVADTVNLNDASIQRDLRFDDCTFGGDLLFERASSIAPISLNRVQISGSLSLAEFHGTSVFLMSLTARRGVDAHDLSLSGHLRGVFLGGSDVSLNRAAVAGYVELEGLLGSLQLVNARLDSLALANATLDKAMADSAHLRSVDLHNVAIRERLYLENAVVDQSLTVADSQIGESALPYIEEPDATEDPCYYNQRALDGDNAVFGSVQLIAVRLAGVSFNRSTINGHVIIHKGNVSFACLRDGVVHGVLEIAGTTVTHKIDLSSANIERNAYFSDSSLSRLSASEAVFQGSCELTGVRSSNIDLSVARLGRGLLIINPRGSGSIDADNASVGGGVTIEDTVPQQTEMGRLNLSGINVTDAFTLQGMTVRNATIANARLQSSATLQALQLTGTLSIADTYVDGDLHLGNIYAKQVDLSGARVTRTFYFTRDKTPPIDRMLLRDTIVQTLEDRGRPDCDDFASTVGKGCLDPWPAKIELEGFHFSQLGSEDEDGKVNLYNRKLDWWKSWLGRQPHYVPDAYDTLSTAMQGAGYDSNAKAIAEERRDQDRKNSPAPGSLLMLLWGLADGYGYVIYYALFWAVFFILLGALVLHRSGEGKRLHMPVGLTYSFDMLVPLVFLEKEHETIRLQGWAKYYFYLHKVLGYVLATFLVAGLSVLAK